MILSALVPWRTFVMQTRLSPEEIATRLRSLIGPPDFLWSGPRDGGDQAWIGEVSANHAKFRRVIGYRRYRNSLLPRVELSWAASGSGSEVTVRMRMSPVGQLFAGVWFAVAFLQGVTTMIPLALASNGIVASLQSLGTSLLLWLFFTGLFGFEASKASGFLHDNLPQPESGLAR